MFSVQCSKFRERLRERCREGSGETIRVQGSGCGVPQLRTEVFRVQDLGFGVQGSGFRVQGSGCIGLATSLF